MGGFLGIGNASFKTDRGMQLTGMQSMKNIFNYAIPQGENMQASGTESLDKAGDYWSKILSGNRSAVSAAVAPETNAIRSSADARKRQLASSGTARGGGVNETSQRMETDTASKTDSAILGARPEAAKQTAAIGKTKLDDAARILGLGAETATEFTDIAMKSRAQSYKINQDMVGKVTQAIDAALTGMFA